MGPNTKRLVVLFQMAMVGAGLGCGRTDGSSDDTSWSALLADGARPISCQPFDPKTDPPEIRFVFADELEAKALTVG